MCETDNGIFPFACRERWIFLSGDWSGPALCGCVPSNTTTAHPQWSGLYWDTRGRQNHSWMWAFTNHLSCRSPDSPDWASVLNFATVTVPALSLDMSESAPHYSFTLLSWQCSTQHIHLLPSPPLPSPPSFLHLLHLLPSLLVFVSLCMRPIFHSLVTAWLLPLYRKQWLAMLMVDQRLDPG